jgi:acid phosphatase
MPLTADSVRHTYIQSRLLGAKASRALAWSAVICVVLAVVSCGSGKSSSSTAPPASVEAKYVALVVLENANYADVVNSANAPYLNSLMTQGALATNYYANVHPSIGNYFMLTTGAMASTDDSYTGTVPPPEMASVLTAAGKSWKVYAEGIPASGYTGGDTGVYLKHHNPFAYFTDVQGTASANNIVPFAQLASDAVGTLPAFSMIVGNIYDVGHNCQPTVTTCTTAIRVQQADAWLKSTLPQVLSNPGFAASGLLAITFDESETDNTDGGGQVATVLLGTNVKPGYQATGTYQHQSLLRLMLEAEGVSTLPGASATAPGMTEVWK